MVIDLFKDFIPSPKQWLVWKSTKRFLNLVAGRRFGKDFVGARKFLHRILTLDYPKIAHLRPPSARFRRWQKPLLHYWALAPDFNIGKTQQREIFSVFPPEMQENETHLSYNDNAKELWLFNGRVLIEFKSGDRPDSLVSVGLNGIYITELARLKERVWDDNVRPTLSDKQGWGIFTTTPLPKKWFLDIVGYGDPKNETYNPAYENFYAKTIDNLRCPGLVEEVELARATTPPKYFRRNYEASLECFEGQIYDDWSEHTHCPVPFKTPRFDMVIAGVDWGFSVPACILVIGVVHKKYFNTYYIIDEHYEANILVHHETADCWTKRAKRLQALHDIKIFYCGPDDPGSIDTFRAEGLPAVPSDNDVTDGIQDVAKAIYVNTLTGEPNLLVDKQECPHWCKEVVSYAFAEGEEKPEDDQEDHALEAGRYAVHTYEKYGGIQSYQTDLSVPSRR